MSLMCRECGVTRQTVTEARKQGWCRHTFERQRTVQWSCPKCQHEQTKRALVRDPNKRFNFYLGTNT